MIWDIPTRIFHWGFVIAISGAYISGERGHTVWHEWFGLSALGLLIFRLIWGFIGPTPARFSQFLYAPRVIINYAHNFIKRMGQDYHGHNPLGGLAVIAMLGLMALMVITGLFNSDDILYEAPLARIWPAFISLAGSLHATFHSAIIPLIALHIGAIIMHRVWLGEKLLQRMTSTAPAPQTKTGLVLLALCLICAWSLRFIG